jgi:hypothetical protein
MSYLEASEVGKKEKMESVFDWNEILLHIAKTANCPRRILFTDKGQEPYFLISTQFRDCNFNFQMGTALQSFCFPPYYSILLRIFFNVIPVPV